MRAVSRFGYLLLAGGILFLPATALAQEVPPPASSDTPATDAIGPRDLQNFSLNGTVTRAADQPATTPSAPQQRPPRSEAQTAPATSQPATPATETARGSEPTTSPAPSPRPTQTASAETSPPPPQAAAEQSPQPSPSSSVTVPLPGVTGSATTPQPSAGFAPEPPTGTLAPEHKISFLPWLLAALALVVGGAFLFWRSRQREELATAGGPQADMFTAPEPAPAPAPRPAPAPPPAAPKAPPPASLGIVSTRLRPWIEIGFHPLRCVLENERVTMEFELELFNSGSAPARAVLAEASLFNAGATQDREIGNFFANPVAQGERIAVIPPLKRVALKTQVVAPRAHLQAYELGGHEVFVPIIGFNALYSWSGGEGQTSASYLLGRDTKGEKMGPFRLDLGPHIFRGVASKLLPEGVRK
ncbi:MAG TPA: hypothetical protein VH392_07105 [Sphingomicrobium sp.]